MATACAIGSVDNRREPRYVTNISGKLKCCLTSKDIVVENLSRSGALIRSEAIPLEGTEVVLATDTLQVVATVAWAEDRLCGLQFHRAIGSHTLWTVRG